MTQPWPPPPWWWPTCWPRRGWRPTPTALRRPRRRRRSRPPAPAARAARLHALGLACLLGEVRRPRRVAQTLLLVAAREVEQGIERMVDVVDGRADVADLAQARGNGVQAQVLGRNVGHLVPAQRA